MLRKTNLPAFQTIPTDIPEILTKIEDAKDPSQQAMMGGMGAPNAMGGIVPGQNPNAQPQQEVPPEVKQNDEVFKDVMRKFLANSDIASQPQEPQPSPQKAQNPIGGVEGS